MKAINEFRAAEAARFTNEILQTATPGPSLEPSVPQPVQPATSTSSNKHPYIKEISDDDIDEHENACTNPKHKKLKRWLQELTWTQWLIADTGSTHELRTTDIEEFFSTTFDHTGSNGKVKKHRKCKICQWAHVKGICDTNSGPRVLYDRWAYHKLISDTNNGPIGCIGDKFKLSIDIGWPSG
ncbi:hypothetical protein BDR03DRAFT_986963 [Suillus americanus]|nr:hypothetical protein BDR03DRAFT_986963 [Suillus americanus]